MVDLFSPYDVRGEVQKRTTLKVWGVLITDMCCRAVHIECVFGYDTEQFLIAMQRFGHLRGWPQIIYSDPGSQLVGASNELRDIWESIDKDAVKRAGASTGTEWVFGPADSPWYQGAAESLIKSAKKAITVSIGSSRVSAPEMLTAFYGIADMLNSRPIGFIPGPDSPINILTPNCLILGRSSSSNPGGYFPECSLGDRHTLVRKIEDQFWKQWKELYVPTMLKQSKWTVDSRQIQVGDVVVIQDSDVLKNEYRLARVVETLQSSDGHVRRCKLAYKNYKTGEALHEYRGAPDTVVERSVQRLALLVPVS